MFVSAVDRWMRKAFFSASKSWLEGLNRGVGFGPLLRHGRPHRDSPRTLQVLQCDFAFSLLVLNFTRVDEDTYANGSAYNQITAGAAGSSAHCSELFPSGNRRRTPDAGLDRASGELNPGPAPETGDPDRIVACGPRERTGASSQGARHQLG